MDYLHTACGKALVKSIRDAYKVNNQLMDNTVCEIGARLRDSGNTISNHTVGKVLAMFLAPEPEVPEAIVDLLSDGTNDEPDNADKRKSKRLGWYTTESEPISKIEKDRDVRIIAPGGEDHRESS